MRLPCGMIRLRDPARVGLTTLVLGLGSGCDAPAPGSARPRPAAARAQAERAAPRSAEPKVAARPAVPAATRAPATVDTLGKDERDRFRAAVDEGRRLHGQEDYAGAIEAYGRALDLLPDDPSTLSELGWASIFAGRLDEAETVLRRAEAGVGGDDSLRASILYNIGRMHEARDERDAAIEAYQRSMELRPHPSTYAHLSALSGGSRYAFGPAVHRLQGPYARLSELCAEERRLTQDQRTEDEDDSFGCLLDAARGLGGEAVDVPRSGRLPAPWKGLRFVEVRPNAYAARFHAALRTDAGWFVLPEVASLARGAVDSTERVTKLDAQVEALVTDEDPLVVLEVETRWTAEDDGREVESETHRVEFLCGRGRSGVPSCTGALPRETFARRWEAGEVEQTRWAVERAVRPDGILVLTGDPSALDEPAAALLGEHPLAFP